MKKQDAAQPRFEHVQWQDEPAVRFWAGGYEALMLPGVGAQVIELQDLQRGLTLLRYPEGVGLDEFKARPQIYGIPILFPPNRIADGKFPMAGTVVDFPLNGNENNHIHGFLRLRPWEVVTTAVTGATVVVEAAFTGDNATDAYDRYLNQFEFRMRYTLSAAGLQQTLTIGNRGTVALPLGVGFHTALQVPFHPESKAEDCRLRVSVGAEWELDERTLPTGKLLPLNEADQAYRTVGVMPQGSPISAHYTAEALTVDGKPFHGALIEDGARRLRVVYRVDAAYRHWMLWNYGGDKGFFCPEPQTWAINAPNLKLAPEITGYRELQPGEIWSAETAIYVEEL